MAEYIDRDKVFEAVDKRVDELKGDKQFTLPKEICVRGVMKHLVNIPIADVVERSKIDKTIEEMEKFKEDVTSTNDLYAQSCVGYCIAILKENIGEQIMSVIIKEKTKPSKCEDCFAFCQTLNSEGSDWNCYCGIDRNKIFDKK